MMTSDKQTSPKASPLNCKLQIFPRTNSQSSRKDEKNIFVKTTRMGQRFAEKQFLQMRLGGKCSQAHDIIRMHRAYLATESSLNVNV